MTKDLLALPALRTERFVLRPLHRGDADAVVALTNHRAITDSVHFLSTPFTMSDAQYLLGEMAGVTDQFMGVRFYGEAALVAVIGVHLRGEAYIEIGYWVHPAQQRRGVAFEAVSALLPVLKKRYSTRDIIAECRVENTPSWALLEKLGFCATAKKGLRPGRHLLIWRGMSCV